MATRQNPQRNQGQPNGTRGVSGSGSRNNGGIVDDPIASAERTALMVGLLITMTLILGMTIGVVILSLKLKQERDVNEILKAKIVGRLIQCP